MGMRDSGTDHSEVRSRRGRAAWRCVGLSVLGAALVGCGASGSGAAETGGAESGLASGGAEGVTEPRASSAPSDPRFAAILEAHDARRARHCAAPLAWSDELARVAQSWADELARRDCAFEHNQTQYGENLAAGTAGAFSPEEVVELWYRERQRYRFGAGRFSMETGHFTQLVWRATERVGCGTTTCNGLDVWVCNYDPPGNVEGAFRENVLASGCR
jgi:pathogenesis-related protein 1